MFGKKHSLNRHEIVRLMFQNDFGNEIGNEHFTEVIFVVQDVIMTFKYVIY